MQEKSVLKCWVIDLCTWKEQTVLLCALRGTDSGGSEEAKRLTRWLRKVILSNAAPNKTFMKETPALSVKFVAENYPLVFDMLPVHFLTHLMHAFEVVAYRYPPGDVQTFAKLAYADICDFLHVVCETQEQMTLRLRDET